MPVAISDSTGNPELRLYKDSLSSEFAKGLMYSSVRTLFYNLLYIIFGFDDT